MTDPWIITAARSPKRIKKRVAAGKKRTFESGIYCWCRFYNDQLTRTNFFVSRKPKASIIEKQKRFGLVAGHQKGWKTKYTPNIIMLWVDSAKRNIYITLLLYTIQIEISVFYTWQKCCRRTVRTVEERNLNSFCLTYFDFWHTP